MQYTMLLLVLALSATHKPIFAKETPTPQDNPAEAAWLSLQSQLPQRSAPNSQNSSAQTPVQQRQPPPPDWKTVAQKCRDYLAQFPNSEHDAEARKLELTVTLGPAYGSGNLPPEIKADLDAYLRDASIPAADRYDISRRAKDARMKLVTGMKLSEVAARHLANAKELAAEFPADSRAWINLYNRATAAPSDDANAALALVAQAPQAPAETRQAAQDFLARRALLGKPLTCVDLSFAAGKPVMLYFWSYKKPQSLETPRQCAKIEGAAFVGINTDGDEAEARRVAAQLALPGTQIYDGAQGKIRAALHASEISPIYLADATGALVDADARMNIFGRLKALVASSSPASRTSQDNTNSNQPATSHQSTSTEHSQPATNNSTIKGNQP